MLLGLFGLGGITIVWYVLTSTVISEMEGRYFMGTDTVTVSYVSMWYNTENSKTKFFLMLANPISYFIVRNHARKSQVKQANKLLRCMECEKYSRYYQAGFVADHMGKCVHCGSTVIDAGDLDTSVEEFLKDFPECPMVDYDALEVFHEWYKARVSSGAVTHSNIEIQRIMDSYRETGNQYMEKLYKKDSTK